MDAHRRHVGLAMALVGFITMCDAASPRARAQIRPSPDIERALREYASASNRGWELTPVEMIGAARTLSDARGPQSFGRSQIGGQASDAVREIVVLEGTVGRLAIRTRAGWWHSADLGTYLRLRSPSWVDSGTGRWLRMDLTTTRMRDECHCAVPRGTTESSAWILFCRSEPDGTALRCVRSPAVAAHTGYFHGGLVGPPTWAWEASVRFPGDGTVVFEGLCKALPTGWSEPLTAALRFPTP